MTDIGSLRTRVGGSSLSVSPIALGGDVLGWTADEATSRQVLDHYTGAGGNFIDTADVYSAWAPAHTGGESESVIGRWLSRRNDRDDLVIASKVGKKPDLRGLSSVSVRQALSASLARLGSGHLDLYYAHPRPDLRAAGSTPLSRTLPVKGDLWQL